MKTLIVALALLSLIPIAQAINITCDSTVNCFGDVLNKVNDCTANTEQFYVNTSVTCPDGCDPTGGRCFPPINLDPNRFISITNKSCSDTNTLMIEEKEFSCIGNSCRWQNNTQYKFCDNGCYENVDEQGAGCSPTEFSLVVEAIIIFFAFLVLFTWFIGQKKKKKKKGGRRW